MSFSDDEDFEDIYGDAPKAVETKPVETAPELNSAPTSAPEISTDAPIAPIKEPTLVPEPKLEQSLAQPLQNAPSNTDSYNNDQQPAHYNDQSSGMNFQAQQQESNEPVKADLSSELKKMFVGGLNWDTTEDDLREYFSKYGVVQEVVIRKDREGKSKGYGFVDFENASAVEEVLSTRHILDGKVIDPKRAIPKTEQDKVGKIFVGGLPPEIKPKGFKEFFSQFGNVLDAQLMINKNTGMCRGFGFITYDSPAAIEPLVAKKFIDYNGRDVEIKRAEQKASLATPARGRNNQFGNQNGMPQMGMPMDPQQMQQYWAMMQENYRQMAEQQGIDVNQMMQQGQQQMMMMMNMANNNSNPSMNAQPQAQGFMGGDNSNGIPVIGEQTQNNSRFENDQRGGFRGSRDGRDGFRGGRGGFRGGRGGRGGFRGGRGGRGGFRGDRNGGQRDYHPYRN